MIDASIKSGQSPWDVVAQAVVQQFVGGGEMLLGLAPVAEAAWARPVREATSALAAGRPAVAAADAQQGKRRAL
ncbi:hypothetical protein ABZ137_28530 [Streptomyces bobili]|uniref:hypothetical protein n=1 Tax=Streptomyces bobili TaxID=67280 RepID=UPI0033BBC945